MMQYLSVHDLVWINSSVLGKSVDFDYETLEAAMASQYSYGNSTNVAGQAAGLLASFLKKPPFEIGNRRTAFIAVGTFLTANGYRLKVNDDDSADIVQRTASREITPADAVELLAEKDETSAHTSIPLRTLVSHVMNGHTAAIQNLTRGDE